MLLACTEHSVQHSTAQHMSSTRCPPQSHLQQAGDLLPECVTPLKEVVPEEAGHAGVREDVGIPLAYFVVWEGPVRLRAACVMAAQQHKTHSIQDMSGTNLPSVRVARQHVVRLFVEG